MGGFCARCTVHGENERQTCIRLTPDSHHWHPQVLVTDTVGFIQKLPTQLVAAFRATLEEITEASVLVHVVDVSDPKAAAQSEAVNKAPPPPPPHSRTPLKTREAVRASSTLVRVLEHCGGFTHV